MDERLSGGILSDLILIRVAEDDCLVFLKFSPLLIERCFYPFLFPFICLSAPLSRNAV